MTIGIAAVGCVLAAPWAGDRLCSGADVARVVSFHGGPDRNIFRTFRKISRVRGRPFGDLDVELARRRGRRRWAGRKPKMPRDADEALMQLDSLCLRWRRWYEQISENADPQTTTLTDLPKSVALLLAKATPAVRRVELSHFANSRRGECDPAHGEWVGPSTPQIPGLASWDSRSRMERMIPTARATLPVHCSPCLLLLIELLEVLVGVGQELLLATSAAEEDGATLDDNLHGLAHRPQRLVAYRARLLLFNQFLVGLLGRGAGAGIPRGDRWSMVLWVGVLPPRFVRRPPNSS